jgi:hypothetical protein
MHDANAITSIGNDACRVGAPGNHPVERFGARYVLPGHPDSARERNNSGSADFSRDRCLDSDFDGTRRCRELAIG